MRKLIFLFPELNIRQGGHSAQLAFMNCVDEQHSAEAVTYKNSTPGTPHLDEILKRDSEELNNSIFVVHWGPDVPVLVKRLKGFAIVYIAHSTGWGFKLPTGIPILAVSRHTQSYWASRAPQNPIFYLPNIIDDRFYSTDKKRTTDVLVMQRKTTSYVLDELVPELTTKCRVRVITDWIDDLSEDMRDSKIFLYDSRDFWRKQGVSEGFGLPPLEAMACGCAVFSSLNHALSDYLDPTVNCQQLGVHSVEYDRDRILGTLAEWTPEKANNSVADFYRLEKITNRFGKILVAVNEFFDMLESNKDSSGSSLISNLFKPD